MEDVTWPCDVRTNFAEKNLGCRERVISGISWAFTLVEEAIILEDDCLPDPSFFPYCQELLERYRGDSRIGMISGDNFAEEALQTEYSYFFSRMPAIWGWATWKPAWEGYDRHLERWPEIKRANLLSEMFDDPATVRFWTARFDEMHDDTGPNTWDYQWTYTNFIHNTLTIVPRVNLVKNIGFGTDATHTKEPNGSLIVAAKSLDWPLRHPPSFLPLRSVDQSAQKLHLPPAFVPGKIRGARRRIRKLLEHLKS